MPRGKDPLVRVETPHYSFLAGIDAGGEFRTEASALKLYVHTKIGSAWAFRLSKILAAESEGLPIGLATMILPDALGSQLETMQVVTWKDRASPAEYTACWAPWYDCGGVSGTNFEKVHAVAYDQENREFDVSLSLIFQRYEF